jgi:Zn-dependent protease
MNLSYIQIISVWILPLLLAITLHEAAHAFVANYFGDATAKFQGRLSLNPIKHIDLYGTIIIPIVILVVSGFQFTLGWAKPVPIDHRNFKNPNRDMAFTSVAGPSANIVMALFWIAILKTLIVFQLPSNKVVVFIALMCQVGIVINIVLAILNMIPIPPLDGSRVVSSLLPTRWAYHYNLIEPYGIIILIILMATGLLGGMIMPGLKLLMNFLFYIFNLPPIAQ